jgi:RES domain-containing protein
MKIRAWRITKAKHAATAFSGMGAKAFGGRWNGTGVGVVYCAGSTSLAILEMLVHLDAAELMRRYVSFEVTFDDSLVTAIDAAKLPKNWRQSPAAATVQAVGDQWVADGTSAVLRVPSVIVPSEWNYLMNPLHPDFTNIAIGPKQPLKFDPRLMKVSTS